MFIRRVLAAIFAWTFMKTLFTSAATAYRTLAALIYTLPLKINVSQDNAVSLFLTFSQTTNFRLF